MSSDGFWNNQNHARKIVDESKLLKAQCEPLALAIKDFDDAKLAYEMSRESSDKDLLAEADNALFNIRARMDAIEL